VDLSNRLEQNLHTIPEIVNGLIQEGNNKVKPEELGTISSDCMNVKHDVGKRDNKNSILVTCDSPASGCSVSLKNKLINACHVIGIVKPGCHQYTNFHG
jgi:exopolysaccharide biosynthesis protein